jgi:hypothetical protein
MVVGKDICLRRLAKGNRAKEVQFNRFLANDKVTVTRLIEGWSESTVVAAEGRHVLAIQDTSEINFATTPERRRGLGEIGKGVGRGALLHPMLAVDAQTRTCLGLLTGEIWTRSGRRTTAHASRDLSDKESQRWATTANTAKSLLANATMVTSIGDRESDIYAAWACVPGDRFHVIARNMNDRKLTNGTNLYQACEHMPIVSEALITVVARAQRPQRLAHVELRFTTVTLRRPDNKFLRHLPKSVTLTLVDVREPHPPAGAEALHWRLLTTHTVASVQDAWRIVDWYKQRWLIEQYFRVLKLQGFKIEDSQIATADRLLKLIAIAAKAAVITIQLLQARDGRGNQSARIAFNENEIAALAAFNKDIEDKSRTLKNPHAPESLAWAAWIIGRLGGWDGYPSSKPPGPITMKHGLDFFHAAAVGWSLRNVCMP